MERAMVLGALTVTIGNAEDEANQVATREVDEAYTTVKSMNKNAQ